MSYEWPLSFPPEVLDEALHIALQFLEGTGQARPGDGTEHFIAAVILAAWKQGTSHRIRLANAAILAIEKAPLFLPSPAVDLRAQGMRDRFFDC